MKVVCIGAGRLAHHLMPALKKAGCNIVQIYNRTNNPSALLARRVDASNYTTELKDIHRDADLYFLTLSDDAIQEIAQQLEFLHDIEGIGIHCSGVLGLDILPFKHKGIFYPLQTFSEHHEVDWLKTPIIITANSNENAEVLKQLAATISSEVYEMNDAQKIIIHLAAVFANNFANHMLALAEKICKEHDVSFDILKPLIEMTMKKALASSPSLNQTGPAARGDEATIQKHLALLGHHPEIAELYKVITKSIRS